MTDHIHPENVDELHDPGDNYEQLPASLKEYVAQLALNAHNIDTIIVASANTIHVRSLDGFDPDIFNIVSDCGAMVASTSDHQVVVTGNE